ncbi:MAG TPA: glucokinase [Gammaproteobacteria bacterium]|nr:glucokinase [Gammaproteobacteria bacterium]
MILGADVGGTKSLLEARAGSTRLLQRRYENDDYASFDAVLDDFLRELRRTCLGLIERACIAVAGPIAGAGTSQRATVTNRPEWRLEAGSLAQRHGLAQVVLVNDFAAVAYGLDALAARERVCLQTGQPVADGLRLALGPGTGLGVAALVDGRVIASEGGHLAFAPWDAESLALWRYLGGERRRVSNEDVVSGTGLLACYRYCVHATQGITPDVAAPAIVVKRALDEHDPVARRALELFARCFGSIAGDLALAFLPRGGIYLAGGITVRVLPALQGSGFLERFTAKAEHAGLVATLPVHAVLAEDVGLRGALGVAARGL